MKGWAYVLLIEIAMRCWDLGDWLEDRATKLGGKVIQGPWRAPDVVEPVDEYGDEPIYDSVVRPYPGSVNPSAKIIPFPRRAS